MQSRATDLFGFISLVYIQKCRVIRTPRSKSKWWDVQVLVSDATRLSLFLVKSAGDAARNQETATWGAHPKWAAGSNTWSWSQADGHGLLDASYRPVACSRIHRWTCNYLRHIHINIWINESISLAFIRRSRFVFEWIEITSFSSLEKDDVFPGWVPLASVHLRSRYCSMLLVAIVVLFTDFSPSTTWVEPYSVT